MPGENDKPSINIEISIGQIKQGGIFLQVITYKT